MKTIKARKTNKSNKKGFTIIELLIAVSVATIAVTLIMYAFVFLYGGLVKEQTRANMVLESQVFLKKMVEDIRVANKILATNTLTDSNRPSGWTTNDPANILVLTQPVVNSSKDFVFDTATGYPYQNEIIYFGEGGNMYRRTIANLNAAGNSAQSTCPAGTLSCSPDIQLTDDLVNMSFIFYDINDAVTATPENARSVELTVTLKNRVYGQDIIISDKTRVTLRNEN